MAILFAGTGLGMIAPCVGCNAISAIGCRELALLLIRTSPVGLNWTALRKVYWTEGAGFPTGYWNGVAESGGLELPMQYAEVTLGRVSNVDPVPDGASVCVHRWTLSILVSLPTWVSLVGSIVAGLFGSYIVDLPFDATIDMINLPTGGVSGFGDAGF